MTTPLDIIGQALKAIGAVGVGQTPLAEDANDSLFQLNMMISQWNQRRWLVYRLVDSWITSSGLMYYTIGSGGNFDIDRPSQIEAAFVRYLTTGADFNDDFSVDFDTGAAQNIDMPLKNILAREDYNRIWAKRLTGPPAYFFYDSAFPLGKLYLWPIPNPDVWSIHISTRQVITQFDSLSEDIELPPEYFAALYYNLAVRLGPLYRVPIREDIVVLAKDALETVRGANVQIPTLVMPDGVTTGWSQYNIYNNNM